MQGEQILPEYVEIIEDRDDKLEICLKIFESLSKDGKRLYKFERSYVTDMVFFDPEIVRLKKSKLYRLDMDNFTPFV